MTVGWGLTFVVVKDALALSSPGAFLTARFAIATVAAALLARRRLWHWPSIKGGALMGLALFLGYAFQTWGLRYTTPTRSGFLTGLTVVLVPLFRALLLRQRAHLAAYGGAALATAGLFLMSAPALLQTGDTLKGDLLTVLCTVSFGLAILVTERVAPTVRPDAASVSQSAVVGVLSALTLPFEEIHFSASSGALWGALLLTGVFNSAIAFTMQIWAQARTTAVRAALIFSLEPLSAALFAHLLAGEALVREVAWGGALILAGNLAAELWPRLETRGKAPTPVPASPGLVVVKDNGEGLSETVR